LLERSFVAKHVILDHVVHAGSTLNVLITPGMLASCADGQRKYHQHLDDERKKKEKLELSSKRKAIHDEMDELKVKRKRLEEEVAALYKSADDFCLQAEDARYAKDIKSLVAKSNSHRRSGPGKAWCHWSADL
jgi:hypothetical protein